MKALKITTLALAATLLLASAAEAHGRRNRHSHKHYGRHYGHQQVHYVQAAPACNTRVVLPVRVSQRHGVVIRPGLQINLAFGF